MTSPHWKETDVPVNGFNIHTYRAGSGSSTLVMAHGFSDDALCWTNLSEALLDDFEIVLYDEVGHGQSARVKEMPSLDSYDPPEHLHAVIQALDLSDPILLGHSMGGATVTRFAAKYPDTPKAILLEDLPWRPPLPPSSKPGEKDPYYYRLQVLQQLSLNAVVAYARQKHATWQDQSLPYWAASKQRFDLDFYDLRPAFRPDYTTILPTITCPALFLYGDADLGGIITPNLAQNAIQLMPDAQAVHIRNAGHCIRYEQFTPYLEAVRAFLTHYQ
ncbi:alpha/beta hydrolase [bacterium]|nr:alpha/beta hydrolase [bacterium]